MTHLLDTISSIAVENVLYRVTEKNPEFFKKVYWKQTKELKLNFIGLDDLSDGIRDEILAVSAEILPQATWNVNTRIREILKNVIMVWFLFIKLVIDFLFYFWRFFFLFMLLFWVTLFVHTQIYIYFPSEKIIIDFSDSRANDDRELVCRTHPYTATHTLCRRTTLLIKLYWCFIRTGSIFLITIRL